MSYGLHEHPMGHFAQIVWLGATHIGAARSSNGFYIAANYEPLDEEVFDPERKAAVYRFIRLYCV